MFEWKLPKQKAEWKESDVIDVTGEVALPLPPVETIFEALGELSPCLYK
jgi:hypothetical protein